MAREYHGRLSDLTLTTYGNPSDTMATTNHHVVTVHMVEATLMGGGNEPLTKAELDRLMRMFEPCKSPDEPGGSYSDPWQRRRGRSKNKSPQHKRVAKRRRRTQLAKETRKLMKLAEQRREAERAKLAAKERG